jgi:hypothetical protein
MYNMPSHHSHREHRHDEDPISIRRAVPSDRDALRRLAERDSAVVPRGQMLVAIVGGEPRAAVSLSTGEAIADPFHSTDGIVRLLRERADQLCRPARWLDRLRTRGARRSTRALSPQPAGTLRAFD